MIIKAFCFLLVTYPAFSTSFSQNLKELFLDAEYSLEIMEFEPALKNYLILLKKDPENCNLNYRAGNCCLQITERKKEALTYLEKAIKQISVNYKAGSFNEKTAPPDAFMLYGIALLNNNKINEAREAFKKYKDYLQPKEVAELDAVNQQLKYCDNAEIFSQTSLNISVTPLPISFNQAKPKLRMVTNAEESQMVFLADKGGKPGIFYTYLTKGQWSTPTEITKDLEIDPNIDLFNICSMSADGRWLYLEITDEFDSRIYVAKLIGTKWSECTPLNRKINSSNDETHAAESPDGKELYITSNRKGTIGNLDIYVSRLKTNGEWDTPTNLGNTINTYFNEETPFVSNDNLHLFFSSQGHSSMGGYDIFVSDRLPNGEWGEPRNIGYPINTTSDDLFYFPLDSNKALYQLDHSAPFAISQVEILPKVNNIINTDTLNLANADTVKTDTVKQVTHVIETFDTTSKPIVEKDTTPIAPVVAEPVISQLKGKISFSDDSKSFDIINAFIMDKNNNKKSLSIRSDGTFDQTISPGQYKISFEANEYQKVIKNILITKGQPAVLDIMMRPEVIKEQYVSIRSILFNYNSVLLDNESKTMLERLIRIMRDYPSLTIEIIGHADSKGNPEYNRKISLDRARAVADYFVNQGIDENRFTLFGFGDALAIAIDVNPDGSDNPAGRRFNRRVELRLANYSNLKIVNTELEIPENLRIKETFEYYICLKESPTMVSKDEYISKADTSMIKINNIGQGYIVTLNPPMSKAEAIKKLEEINNTFPEAYIIPDNYFTKVKKVSTVGSYRYASSGNFTIQLLATKRKMKTTAFKPYTDVREYKGMDGLLRYTYGLFSSWDNAYPTLLKVRKQGYNDAFIAPMAKFTGNLLDKKLNGYTIQLWAGFTPKDTNIYRNVGPIKVNKTSDNVYRYSTGTFETFPEAKARLKQLQKLGYSNALIKKQSDMEK
ncbi:MAG TPA: OmpA family protein [Bacteroidales bacterium]